MGVLKTLFRACCLSLVLLSGCVSPRATDDQAAIDWDEFMETMRQQREAQEQSDTGANVPDMPASELPPPPGADGVAGLVTIQPDSVVQVSVREDSGLDGSYQVNELSAIQLGYVGPVFLYNMTEEEAAEKIKEVLESRFFNRATVTVRILRASYDKVAIQGRVTQPGILKIGSGDRISLNDALLRVGNVTAPIKNTRIRIVRGGLLRAVAASEPGEVYSLVDADENPQVPDVSLWNNDVAYVYVSSGAGDDEVVVSETVNKDILVLGEVNRQGIYRFSEGAPSTMLHLVFKMGGFPAYADTRNVRVIRQTGEGRENEMVVNVDRILEEGNPDLDVPLEHGDRIIVPARRMSLF